MRTGQQYESQKLLLSPQMAFFERLRRKQQRALSLWEREFACFCSFAGGVVGASEPLMLWVVVAIASQERERFRSPFGLPCTSEIPRVYCVCRVLF